MKRQDIIKNIQRVSASKLPTDSAVILFGSQARGDFSPASDWDLLILLNRTDNIGIMERGEYIFPMYELGAELGIEINPVIYTYSDWQKRNFTPFYKNVTTDGIKIWG